MPFWTIPTLIAFATGTVWLRLTIVGTTYAIHQAERNLELLHQQREVIDVKMTELRSPKRLENLARTKFNLSPPKMEQVVYFHTPYDH
jgi:hypothetical protein